MLPMHGSRLSRAVVVLVLSLMCRTTAAQDETSTAALEIRKLELEIARLEQELGEWATWNPFILGGAGALFAASIAAFASIWVANRTRRGSLDQAVHEKRLEYYPKLVKIGAPLALYFPDSVIDRAACGEMGAEMRELYFSGGGLLMSEEARETYFLLALALALANASDRDLDVPSREEYYSKIDSFVIDKYRKTLGIPTTWHRERQSRKRMEAFIREWKFGDGKSNSIAHTFKDYVFLQAISSELRAALTEDLHSRRLPS
jgi:hypothetical protein